MSNADTGGLPAAPLPDRSAFERQYLLLTPGPLSTTATVRAAMGRDWCTWDPEYNEGVVEPIRRSLVALADPDGRGDLTSVLLQGSGTASVEATVGGAVGDDGRLLVLANGHYGERIGRIAEVARLDHHVLDFGELGGIDMDAVAATIDADPRISHVAMVHCETTTGRLNPLEAVAATVGARGRSFIVDAMSSFGGMPIDVAGLGVDFLVSSANKCIQGVPGFGLVVARRTALEGLAGRARSLSLDLHGQWAEMERKRGKWRYTSPTHAVRAFAQALRELDAEGGVEARHRRYSANHRTLVDGMRAAGFATLLPDEDQSPFITAFAAPDGFVFEDLYMWLKRAGFVIYPGKVTAAESFRIGTIGDVQPSDIAELVAEVARWRARR